MEHDDDLTAWQNMPAVGAERIFDRYSVQHREVSKADFLADPDKHLNGELPFYIVNPAGSDWVVVDADYYYSLIARIDELTGAQGGKA